MEPIEACFSEEWESSLSGFYPSVEGDHFMAHLYVADNTFNNNGIAPSDFLSIDEANVNINETEGGANLYNFSDTFHSNFRHFSEENSNSSGSNSSFFPAHSYENNQFFCESNQMLLSHHDNIHESTNISSAGFLAPVFSHHAMEEVLFMKTEMNYENSEIDYFRQENNVADLGEDLKLKRKFDMQEHEASGYEKMNNLIESPKKKPRLPRDAQKGKKNAMSRKGKKISNNDDDEEENGTKDAQNSSSSEGDNSNIASQDFEGKANVALNSSGKTRACRGAATDPQSLYARKRRERINQRLRILQNLVPNGTKVDISTMLEEAVQYVKFLQLQIKLLSSDEFWMFAPIAYNGMDMGLYNKLSI